MKIHSYGSRYCPSDMSRVRFIDSWMTHYHWLGAAHKSMEFCTDNQTGDDWLTEMLEVQNCVIAQMPRWDSHFDNQARSAQAAYYKPKSAVRWFLAQQLHNKREMFYNDTLVAFASLLRDRYDWRWRSLNPYFTYDHGTLCWRLCVPNRTCYDAEHNHNTIVIAHVTKEMMEMVHTDGVITDTDYAEDVWELLDDAVGQALAWLEPQYHDETAGYY